MDTGIPEVDVFENLKSFDVTVNPNIQDATGFADNNVFKEKAESENALFDESNPFAEVSTSTDTLGVSLRTDTTSLTADQTTIRADRTKNG